MNKTQFMDFLYELADVFDTAADEDKITSEQHRELFNMSQATFKKAKSQNYKGCEEIASALAKQLQESQPFWQLLGNVCRKHKVVA